jgi:hypothetical protein
MRTESGENKTSWVELLRAWKGMFQLVSNGDSNDKSDSEPNQEFQRVFLFKIVELNFFC